MKTEDIALGNTVIQTFVMQKKEQMLIMII